MEDPIPLSAGASSLPKRPIRKGGFISYTKKKEQGGTNPIAAVLAQGEGTSNYLASFPQGGKGDETPSSLSLGKFGKVQSCPGMAISKNKKSQKGKVVHDQGQPASTLLAEGVPQCEKGEG